MVRFSVFCALAMYASLTAVMPVAAEERWKIPAVTPEARLPRLKAMLNLDGELTEWQGVPSVPVRFQSFIAHRQLLHQWRGPSDLSAEFLCAWSDDGICLAASVFDDDLVNDREIPFLWQQDCIELFVDCRAGEKFLKPPYSAGAYQIFIRPPLDDKEPLIAVNPQHGALPGMKIAGKLTAGGYTVEIFLPWSAFSNFKPMAGSAIGLQFAVDDYDRCDGDMKQPLTMSWQGATALFNSPQKLMRWTLVETLAWDANTSLAAHLSLIHI